MTPVCVLIVAADPLTRAGLAALLAESSRCEVVGQSAGDAGLADEVDREDPDVILGDLGWNRAEITRRGNLFLDIGAPVVILLPDETETREIAARLSPLGAYGLLLRDSPPNLVAAALESVANGLLVLDPALADAALPKSIPLAEEIQPEPLTPRESEVLQLLARGLTNKAIAQQLSVTEHTVKFHVNAIMGKLNAQSRTDAVVRATRLGLITF